jgi:hypothetical protein
MSRSSRRRIAIAIASAAALLVAGVAWWTRSSPAPALSFHWPAGSRYVYQLDWRSQQSSAALGTPLDGQFTVEGRLELRSHGLRGDVYLLEAVLTAPQVVARAAGVDLLEGNPQAALGVTRASLEITPGGQIRSIGFASDAMPLWQDVASHLLAQLEVVLPSENRTDWQAVQSGPFGRGDVGYRRDGGGIARQRARYASLDALPEAPATAAQTVDGSGAIGVEGGHLAAIDERETIRVTDTAGQVMVSGDARLSLRLVSTGTFTALPLAVAKRRRPGERSTDVGDEHAALTARVDGMTPERLLEDVLILADGGIPDWEAWLWRATALVRLEPELCPALAEAAISERLGIEAKGLIVDLLTGAGTAEAQAALRTILSSPQLHAEPRQRLALVQRLSLLTRPEPETVEMARSLRASAVATGDVHAARAGAFVLGNVAGNLARGGDTAAAAPLAAALAADLARATDPGDRAALITALGATDLPEHRDAIAAHASDPDVDVRYAVAAAMQRTPGDETDAALIASAGDADGAVQGVALRGLGERALNAAALDRLVAALAGGVAAENHGAFAQLVLAQAQRGATIGRFAPIIDAVLAKQPDPAVAGMLRRLRG